MLTLLTAIKNEFVASNLLVELFPDGYSLGLQPNGGLQSDELPAPAAVLYLMPSPKPVNTTPSKDGSFPYTEDVNIQWSVFAPNVANVDEYGVITDGNTFCVNAVDALDAAYHLTRYWDIGDEYSPDAIINSKRTGIHGPYMTDQKEWQVDIFYTVKVQRYTGSI